MMKAHMDAVRNITNANDKLGIVDATAALKEPTMMAVIDSNPMSYWSNQADREQTGDLRAKFTATVDGNNIGCYIPNMQLTAGRYIFECGIRGNLALNRFGEENQNLIIITDSLVPDATQWQKLRIPFKWSASGLAFDLYGIASKGQWFEIDRPCFIKVGKSTQPIQPAASSLVAPVMRNDGTDMNRQRTGEAYGKFE